LQKEGVKTHKEKVEELNKYLSNLSEHHDMYVPLLLGFRFGDGDTDDMSITGRELDLDNTKLGMGGGRKEGSCFFVLWYLVFGVYTRPARSISGGESPCRYQKSCLARERGVCLEELSISRLQILEYSQPQPSPKP
jgi:hypothetical protein